MATRGKRVGAMVAVNIVLDSALSRRKIYIAQKLSTTSSKYHLNKIASSEPGDIFGLLLQDVILILYSPYDIMQ